MTDKIFVGTSIILRAKFYSVVIVDDAPVYTLADPSEVKLHIQPTSGLVISYTFGAPGSPIEKISTGIYTAKVKAEMFGSHWVRWEGAGAVDAATEYSFDVEKQRVNPE